MKIELLGITTIVSESENPFSSSTVSRGTFLLLKLTRLLTEDSVRCSDSILILPLLNVIIISLGITQRPSLEKQTVSVLV